MKMRRHTRINEYESEDGVGVGKWGFGSDHSASFTRAQIHYGDRGTRDPRKREFKNHPKDKKVGGK